MEHPRFVKRIHRFLNPVRHASLRDLDAQRPPDNPLLKRKPGDAISRFETRRAELESPNDVSYGQVYGMLASAIVAVATAILFAAFR